MTRGGVVEGRARTLPAPVFIDLTGRGRVRRITMASAAFAALIVFANSLANGFVLDDRGVVLNNPLVTAPITTWRAFALPYWPETLGGGQYRPLGIVSFALDWAVSGGDARWFHAVNVVWHVAATVLVWVLAAELLAPAAAAITATVFAVHPVHVEAVSNVVGRLEPMATVLVVGALLAHRRGHWSAALLFVLGLLSKEIAIVFVALAAANDLLLERDWRAAVRARRWLYAAYGGVLLVYATALFAIFHGREFSRPARAFLDTSLMERLAIVARVVPHYVRLLVAPAELSASYAPNVIDPRPGFTLAGTLGLLMLLIGIVVFAIVARQRRSPALAFALVWVAVSIAPVSNILFPSGVVLAERTLYLASVGACLVAGVAAERFLLTKPVMVAAATASVVLAFGVRTWTRTPAWRDDRAYVLTLLTDHPESYEAHLAAGVALKGANALEQADRELTIARRLFPRDSVVYRAAADLAERQQHPVVAAALRDSAHIARTIPYASTSLGSR